MKILYEIPLQSDLLNDKTWVTFQDFSEYSLDIDYWYSVKIWKPSERETIGGWYDKVSVGKTYLNLEIMKQFRANNIKLAMPVRLGQIPPEQIEQSLF